MDSEVFMKLTPRQLFLRCAVPAMITSVFGSLYSVVDGIFVGRILGEDALAAISLVMPVIMIVEAIANMIATGTSVKLSLLLGQKKQKEASQIFTFSVVLILAFSCLISLAGLFFARPFLHLITGDAVENTLDAAEKYLKIFAAFGPLIPLGFALDNYLRVCGKERLSMWLGIGSQVLNVVLDFLLIAVLRQGIQAAAAASCISIVLCTVIMLAVFLGHRCDLYYTKPKIKAAQLVGILANGSSEFFSSIAMSVMSVIMNLFLLKYGGATAVAAFSVVMYADSIIGMLNFGLCDSLQPAISYCYGAGAGDRMKQIFRTALYPSAAISVLAFFFMLFAGPKAVQIFIQPGDTELADMSITAVRLFSFSYLAGWIDMCYSSYFTAVERPGRSLAVSLCGTLVFPVIFLILLSGRFGLNGVWLSATVSSAASGAFTLWLAKTMKDSKTE